MSRVLDAIMSVPWAIKPEWLRLIALIAERRLDAPEVVEARARWEAREPGALAVREGTPVDGARLLTNRNGVGILPIVGPIFPRATLFQRMSGATSLSFLAQDFNVAMENGDIRSVLLHIDSPGGVAFGIGEFASQVAAARKPVTAYVGGLGASAAYWIATAADEIVLDPSAMVGSIGVVQGISIQEQPGMDGYRDFEIVSSNAPNKRPDPRTDEGLAEIRRELDALEEIFVAAVAQNRNVSTEKVLNDFGRGGVRVGRRAVELGMADRVGSFEGVLAEMADRRIVASTPRSTATRQQPRIKIMDRAELAAFAAENPGIAAALRAEGEQAGEEKGRKAAAAEAEARIKEARDAGFAEGKEAGRAEGREEGAADERERIMGIDDALLSDAHAGLARQAKAEGWTVERFLRAQTAAEKEARQAALDARRKDELSHPKPDSVPSNTPGGTRAAKPAADPNLPLEDQAKAAWQSSPDLREEFGENFDAYLAYRRAEAKGQIRRFAKASDAA